MKYAISIFGPPYSGKSTMLARYSDRVVYIGGFIRSLPDSDALKQQCDKLFKSNELITPELLNALILRMKLPDHEVVLFDGTPRSVEQLRGLSDSFCFKAGIEIIVEETCWKERIKSARETRPERSDSSYEFLHERRNAYVASVNALRESFSQWVEINNSGEFLSAQEQFNQILDTMLK